MDGIELSRRFREITNEKLARSSSCLR